MIKKFLINNTEVEVDLIKQHDGNVIFNLDGKEYSFQSGSFDAILSKFNDSTTNRHQVFSHKYGNKSYVSIGSQSFSVEDASLSAAKGAALFGAMVSPMPGKILKLHKKAGDQISQGDSILVMEAMKMEHTIKASHDGIIAKINVSEGQQVDGGLVLVELEEKK